MKFQDLIIINKNFVIYILIDSLIRRNINIIKMYDFYSKDYIENESIIYYSEDSQNIFRKKNRNIELNFILFSTMNNTSFKVTPNYFEDGKIEPFDGNLIDGKKFFLQFSEISNISKNISCLIDISLNYEKLQFKIKFIKAPEIIFSDDYYYNFGIKGKNVIHKNWINLNKEIGTKNYYVTPFYYSKIELNINQLKGLTSEDDDLIFYDILEDGKIEKSKKYSKNYESSWYWKKIRVSFSIKYKDLWYPLLHNNGKLDTYIVIYFENWKQIKDQAWKDYYKWINKIQTIQNAYNEISKLNEFEFYEKNDTFYKRCEEIIKKNLNKGIQKFINLINSFKNEAYSKDITFEGLAYYILNNTKNILDSLYNSFPPNIKKILEYDFNYYNKSSDDDNRNLALYNYILNLRDIIEKKEKELKRNDKKIIVNFPNIMNEQKNLLFDYYSIKLNENYKYKPKIILNYEKQLKSFNNNNIDEEGSYEKYLIIGNICQKADINKEQSLDNENKDTMNLKLDNSITLVLPEINLSDYQKCISLNGISELYSKCIIGSRIFPAYLQTAITNENKENLNIAKNYFEILLSVYEGRKENDDSFINEKSKEFISAFQEMIVKLKKLELILNQMKN